MFILCPVCRQDVGLSVFNDHMKKDTIHLKFNDMLDDQSFTILQQAANLGNPYIYYNWDYHIQTKYKISESDIDNYNKTIEELKSNNKDLTLNNIMKSMEIRDSKYSIPRLLPNIIRIVQTMN